MVMSLCLQTWSEAADEVAYLFQKTATRGSLRGNHTQGEQMRIGRQGSETLTTVGSEKALVFKQHEIRLVRSDGQEMEVKRHISSQENTEVDN